MDLVLIERLVLNCVIGIHPFERQAARELWLDLELGFDNRIPASSDRIADTLDYDAVGRRLREFAAGTTFELIESLAEACASLLHREFGVRRVRLTLWKPAAVDFAANVGVRIERHFA
ncbi:dihydroneopterin aldolase [Silanimonas sp.]|uniref:dihydroneopterin aldolase n=1 Tax=Silanimonas sp. TaxID=1929290 RepID=UPI001BBF80E4|nr:dihydroneopterin aldolase [Silanimonas sp.]MBS3896360.1 dihydroneopterin aldolase [Silanimonas sp.]